MEFILQKQGENHGRTISTNSLEIVSGNYRLLARLDSPFVNIEVRIDYESPESSERYTHYYRSDAGGWLEIFSYRDLGIGSWKIRCYGDILAELGGQGWQETLTLIVTPVKINYLAQLEQLIKTEIEPLLAQESSPEMVKLEFADLTNNSAFVFDLCLPEETMIAREGVTLELPEPANMKKSLQSLSNRNSAPLPPKISGANSRRKSPQLPPIPKNQ
ncbi:MAG: hypothetical protein GPI99_15090 [Microcystis aeruginosa W13-15]|nr:hypothetical protein [Microcystis aeruginosa W13-16]NCQ74946.1 hypothetical protein [Microcystis aeruginosa W13-13]NCQ79397.1 hypothetical protein [Microcystis aeruginosa W13-15]NCS53393.1 hypothetical protein [Microcystis aeruginosa G13-05]